MCGFACFIAVLAWTPTLVLGWRSGYFSLKFDVEERACRVSTRALVVAVAGGIAGMTVALTLGRLAGC